MVFLAVRSAIGTIYLLRSGGGRTWLTISTGNTTEDNDEDYRNNGLPPCTMNKKDDQYMVNRNSSLIRDSNRCGVHVGCVRFHLSSGLKHELAKFLVAWELKELGHKVLTEAIFKDGSGRADIVDLTSGEVVEILDTESEADAENKNYPFPVMKLSADRVLKAWGIHLEDK